MFWTKRTPEFLRDEEASALAAWMDRHPDPWLKPVERAQVVLGTLTGLALLGAAISFFAS